MENYISELLFNINDENLKVEKLKKSQLSESLAKGKTSYEQLEEILFGNEKWII